MKGAAMTSRLIERWHANDRGNLGILLLMTIWALVGLIGLLWNTGDVAAHHAIVQNASDTSAHTAATWVSRTTNLVAATNQLLAENGSAEVIWRSVDPTSQAVGNRLNSEQQTTQRLLTGATPGTPESNIPDMEYFEELLGLGAWAGSGRGDGLMTTFTGLATDIPTGVNIVTPHMSGPDAAQLRTLVASRLERNSTALTWLVNTWVKGQAPAQGEPAAPNGGLVGTVGAWLSDIKSRLEDILATIPAEQGYLNQFIAQTDPGLALTNPDQLLERRNDIFAYQQKIVGMTPDVCEEQRTQMATFYKTNVTYATPVRDDADDGPAPINAPVEEASVPEGMMHSDSIRPRYPQAALARFGTTDPNIEIDPINVNVDNSVIWHPGISVPVPAPTYTYKGATFTGSFFVGGGEWGQIYCAPLARFFNDRVWRDEQGLRPYMQGIDNLRNALRRRIWAPSAPPGIPGMPGSIADPTGATPIPIAPEPLPTLPLPAGLTAAEQAQITALNQRINQYNTALQQYVRELQNLYSPLNRMYNNARNIADHASRPFADWTWQDNVEANRALVLESIGQDKNFMVLKSYALRQIPDWAQSSMWDSARQYIYNDIYSRQLGGVTNQVQRQLAAWLFNQYMQGAQNGGQAARQARAAARNQANADAASAAPQIAAVVVANGADYISREVASEWITRPWPYEVDWPKATTPTVRGITDQDRLTYFTLLTAAQTGDQLQPSVFLPKLFPAQTNPLVAYAQAETFNIMEFNDPYAVAEVSAQAVPPPVQPPVVQQDPTDPNPPPPEPTYGGSYYDHVNDYGHGCVGGSPPPWRLSTHGGWNWHPRLAYSDGLGQAMDANSELQQYFNDSGLGSYDANTLPEINMH